MSWVDTHLRWDPREYNGIEKLHIPAKKIWLPDIVLNNNAAGKPQVTIFTDIFVRYTGEVSLECPAPLFRYIKCKI